MSSLLSRGSADPAQALSGTPLPAVGSLLRRNRGVTATFLEEHFKMKRMMSERSSQGFGLQNLSAEKAGLYTPGSSQIWKQENGPLRVSGLMTCLHYEGKPETNNQITQLTVSKAKFYWRANKCGEMADEQADC